jgi:hypothetical protein
LSKQGKFSSPREERAREQIYAPSSSATNGIRTGVFFHAFNSCFQSSLKRHEKKHIGEGNGSGIFGGNNICDNLVCQGIPRYGIRLRRAGSGGWPRLEE